MWFFEPKINNRTGVLAYAGAFNPPQSANLKLWLKADAGITLVGGKVDVWADQSGNNNNAVAPTSTRRPSFNPIGFNNKACIDKTISGDGVGAGFVLSNALSLGDFTMFIVRKKLAAGNKSIYFQGPTTSAYQGDNVDGLGVDAIVNSSFNLASVSSGNAYATTNQAIQGIVTITRSGTSVSQKLNALAELSATRNNTAYPISSMLYYGSLGNTLYDFEGQFAECLVYNSALTVTERTIVQNYLNNKYLVY